MLIKLRTIINSQTCKEKPDGPEYLFAGPKGLFIRKSQVGQSETLSEELVGVKVIFLSLQYANPERIVNKGNRMNMGHLFCIPFSERRVE